MSDIPAPRVETAIADHGGGRIATLTFDNSGKLNTVGSAEVARLRMAFGAVREVDNLRAVILTGAGGRAFIGGANIFEMATLEPDSARRFITALHALCADIRALPVPVVARIEGFCLGAGLEVAAACDYRVAAHGSQFGMPEVRVGIPSVIEAALLPRLIGMAATADLLLTGRTIDAGAARDMRLVNRIVPADALDQAIAAWIDEILPAGPKAVADQKALMHAWEEMPLSAGIQAGIDAFACSFESDEPRRMMDDFIRRQRTRRAEKSSGDASG
ncbi:enoyl-CoA hydratase [Oceanibacterium hippocampi]|uniref:Putative enoyl-CoA hydratase echA8 n=1 Tax=Oceanibacterium hippocampi TaxID=745714 RepID=A0A1Y5RUJ2_9PROT|nr:enoyl-CoA hydratase [Oceanibacterium hippocampi]SLN25832.1 putative enoyl-CoA hydratase echA8 [Oceanibacterium hippocampi]